jgi:TolB protein
MRTVPVLLCLLLLSACQSSGHVQEAKTPAQAKGAEPLLFPGEERHLKNVRQLTFGGQNAEAYFSADGQWLAFQSHRGEHPCDEEYVMRTDGSELRKVSTGKGRVTCGYLISDSASSPEPSRVIFASTHDFGADCPPKPDQSYGYVWPIYSTYEIYSRPFKGGPLERLTKNKFYDAEATVSPDQKEIVFTSTRDGDLDLYTMDIHGKHVKRVTNDLGYDGGAFYSHDGKRLIYRAFHPETAAEKAEYVNNLKRGVYSPTWLELFIIDKDGKNKKQITNLKGATFAPFLFPNDKRVIFASNYKNYGTRKFDLYAVDIDGKNLEQITFSGTFDSFPMFSPDGKKMVWASNRNGKEPHETNIFIADWVD